MYYIEPNNCTKLHTNKMADIRGVDIGSPSGGAERQMCADTMLSAGLSTVETGIQNSDSDTTVPTVASQSLTRQQRKEIKELFRIFDKNKDNTISCRELGKVMGCMGMAVTEAELQTIMNELDRNGNGKIEYKEFYTFMQEELKRAEDPDRQESSIRMAFKVFDKAGDGLIDADELRAAMQNLGEPLTDRELQDMMKGASVTAEGKINYEEFIKIWLDKGDVKTNKN